MITSASWACRETHSRTRDFSGDSLDFGRPRGAPVTASATLTVWRAIACSAGHLCHRDHLVFHLLNFRHPLIERGRLHLAARMHQNDDTVTDVGHHGLRDRIWRGRGLP